MSRSVRDPDYRQTNDKAKEPTVCEAQEALMKLAFELEIQWGAGKLDLPKLKGLATAKCTGHDTPNTGELLGTSVKIVV